MSCHFELSDLDWHSQSLFGLKIPIPVFMLAITLISFTELTFDSQFLPFHFLFPIFIVSDRFLIQSISVSSSFCFQILLFLGTFHLLFSTTWGPSGTGSLVILSFMFSALAATQRLEFVVLFMPVTVYGLFVSKQRFFTILGMATAISVIVIADRAVGSPGLCLNMSARLKLRSFVRTDTNGVWWAGAIAVGYAARYRADGVLGIGLALAGLAVLVMPVGSIPDRDLVGAMVLRLLGYVWVAVVIARNAKWNAIVGMGAGIVVVRVMKSLGWIATQLEIKPK